MIASLLLSASLLLAGQCPGGQCQLTYPMSYSAVQPVQGLQPYQGIAPLQSVYYVQPMYSYYAVQPTYYYPVYYYTQPTYYQARGTGLTSSYYPNLGAYSNYTTCPGGQCPR